MQEILKILERILANPFPSAGVLMVAGAVMGVLRVATVAALLFMLAGMLIMYASGRRIGPAK